MSQDVTIEAMHMAFNILRMLRPHRVEGARKTRLGRVFDGGYVMLDQFEGVEAAYSLGINDDVSWDLDIACRGIPLFQYDHTIERLPVEHALFNWEKLGISSAADADQHLETIENLIKRNGHEACNDLILKCDIEGHEWEVLGNIPNRVLKQFRQIVIEMHNFQDLRGMIFANVAREAIRNLTLSHKVVHVHGNNFARWAVVGGVPVPSALELTLVRHDQGDFVPSDETFPTPLDMPCHSKEADLFLGRFAYE